MQEKMLDYQGKESYWSDIKYRIDEIATMCILANEEERDEGSDTASKLDDIMNVVKYYIESLNIDESIDNETLI